MPFVFGVLVVTLPVKLTFAPEERVMAPTAIPTPPLTLPPPARRLRPLTACAPPVTSTLPPPRLSGFEESSANPGEARINRPAFTAVLPLSALLAERVQAPTPFVVSTSPPAGGPIVTTPASTP